MKLIKYDDDTQDITWSNVHRSSIASMFGGGKDKESSKISVVDIVEVRKGVQTDVLLKAGAVDPNCCLSIITRDRTLDLVLESAGERDNAIRGLHGILDSLEITALFK